MTDADLRELVERLSGPDEVERSYAAEDLGYAGSAAGVRPLVDRLPAETSHSVRGTIFQALERIDDDSVVSACMQLLRSPDAQLRNQSVQLLRRRQVSVVPTLKELICSSDRDLRKFALDVLNRADLPGSDGIYDIALNDEDVNVVYTAVENIGRARKSGFRSRIAGLAVASDNLMLVSACLEALVSIGDAQSAQAVFARYADLASTPPVLVPGWLKLAGMYGSADQAAAVSALLRSAKRHLFESALQALRGMAGRHPGVREDPSLAAAVRGVFESSEAPRVRHEAVLTLGSLSAAEENYQILLLCQKEQDAIVRLAASHALAALGRGQESVSDTAACEV